MFLKGVMIHITRINEFAGSMTGQEWQNALKSFIMRCLQSLHIHYGREFNGAPYLSSCVNL